ncbi:MAG: hypothetical protein K2M68_08310 [Muribaculaceae bacterium]|nr:hypothetical protein [Muribaculaceae bacterium]
MNKLRKTAIALTALMTTAAASAEWVERGTGVYTEGLFTYYAEVSEGAIEIGMKWNVKVEENTETPGLYRFFPYTALSPIAQWMGEADEETYIVLHAEDPDHVWMEDFEPYPDWEMYYFTHMVPESGWEATPAGYGILKDGVITFPAMSLATVDLYDENQNWHATNREGEFKLELPGVEIEKNYTFLINNPYCGSDNLIPVTFVSETDNIDMRYAVYAGHKELTDELVAEVNATGTAATPGTISVKAPAHGVNTLIAVSLDDSGAVQTSQITYIYGIYDNDADWKSLGKTAYTEAIIAEHYEYDPETLQVEIQENINTPGFFRLVNPYAEYMYNFIEREDNHDHYIYIHAENPQAVWIENSALGADFGYGDGRVTSDVARFIEEDGITLEEALQRDVNLGVIDDDNVLTFPKWGIWYADRDYFDGFWYSSGRNFALKIPEGAGIDNIAADKDDATVVYYNLQGIQIERPTTAGTPCIMKQGDKVTKIIIGK